jgi:hypothetical protein
MLLDASQGIDVRKRISRLQMHLENPAIPREERMHRRHA